MLSSVEFLELHSAVAVLLLSSVLAKPGVAYGSVVGCCCQEVSIIRLAER